MLAALHHSAVQVPEGHKVPPPESHLPLPVPNSLLLLAAVLQRGAAPQIAGQQPLPDPSYLSAACVRTRPDQKFDGQILENQARPGGERVVWGTLFEDMAFLIEELSNMY